MAKRLIEIYCMEKTGKEIVSLIKDLPVLSVWHHKVEGGLVTKILLEAEESDAVLEVLEKKFSKAKSLRAMIYPVEGFFLRPQQPDIAKQGAKKKKNAHGRVSLEELYEGMLEVSGFSFRYALLTAIAALVAAFGLLKDDVAVLIGSMVIAPLLGPNMALSLATTVADAKLAARAAVTWVVGVSLVLSISFAIGIMASIDLEMHQIALRSDVSYVYIVLALASGVAGAYSMSSGAHSPLVGVMVAVALLPPLVNSGLLLGAGQWPSASGAFLLFIITIVCVNLAGVVTFILQGIRPRKFREARRANLSVAVAIILWCAALGLLVLLIYIKHRKF